MGRPPRPPALKLLEGNPGGRKIDEPIQASVVPPPEPDWDALLPAVGHTRHEALRVRKRAREEWRRVLPELLALRVLSALDGGTLVAYCVAVGRHDELCRVIAREGMFVPSRGGTVKHPAVAAINATVIQIKALGAELALTPASRLRFSDLPTPSGDEDMFS
jgi:P27 family predicted phage terminase small subunit